MRRFLVGRWVGLGMLVPAMITGCRHVNHQCNCAARPPQISAVSRWPANTRVPQVCNTQVATMAYPMEVAPVVTAPVTTYVESEPVTPVTTDVVRAVEPQPQPIPVPPPPPKKYDEDVLLTVVEPQNLNGPPGAITGTLHLTGEQAEELGIHHGSPGATFIAAGRSSDSPIQTVSTSEGTGISDPIPAQVVK